MFLRLTAYVAKVFAMANTLVAVSNDVICDAIKFLILRAQQPNGMFIEVGRVSHGEMIVRALIASTFLHFNVKREDNYKLLTVM